jgi:hypothetical protein
VKEPLEADACLFHLGNSSAIKRCALDAIYNPWSKMLHFLQMARSEVPATAQGWFCASR